MTDYRPTTERALKEITAALDSLAATITPVLDNLATVDAPAPTLAEELRDMLEARDREDPTSFSGLLARVEQVEQERNSLEQQRDYWCDSERQAVKDRDHLAAEIDKANTDILRLTAERDEARAEVERLDAVAEDYARRATAALTERDEAQDEVDRLTADRDTEGPDDNDWLAGMKEAARYAINATRPNPADVKPGEAWIVETHRERRTAVKDRDDYEAWNTFTAGGLFFPENNEDVTLVSRLVPAPRVITNTDELDQLRHRTVIISTDGQADVYQKDSNGEWLDVTSHGYPSRRVIRMENAVTVLWEPEA